MGLSIRAYARHRGVSHVAVKKAIDTGRITPEADGTIEPNRADLEWAQNTVAARKPVAAKTASLAAEPIRPASAPVEPVAPPLSAGGTSLLQARTVNEVVKAQTNKVRLAQLKGDLVDRSQAIAHVFRLARTERDAWLNWPARISAEMAAKLEVDAHELHVALESAVRDHLIELGDMRPRVD
ncbi:MAG TPA: elements of external origin [Accumulibacter sp.]|nr:elements of external origin [Accumulibacter sp.]